MNETTSVMETRKLAYRYTFLHDYWQAKIAAAMASLGNAHPQ